MPEQLLDSDNTLYIPSVLNSFFIEEIKRLPPAGTFKCYGERADVIAYKIYGDSNMANIIKIYNNITHPLDGSTAPGKELIFPSLNSIEKLYSTLTAKQRAAQTEASQ